MILQRVFRSRICSKTKREPHQSESFAGVGTDSATTHPSHTRQRLDVFAAVWLTRELSSSWDKEPPVLLKDTLGRRRLKLLMQGQRQAEVLYTKEHSVGWNWAVYSQKRALVQTHIYTNTKRTRYAVYPWPAPWCNARYDFSKVVTDHNTAFWQRVQYAWLKRTQ